LPSAGRDEKITDRPGRRKKGKSGQPKKRSKLLTESMEDTGGTQGGGRRKKNGYPSF